MLRSTLAATLLCLCAAPAFAQAKPQAPAAPAARTAAPPAQPDSLITPPADYVIGAGDVLTITYYRDKDMTGDYVVRPDGRITLPVINDVVAMGLTPEQLKTRLTEVSAKVIVDPNITVGLRAINSRKVYITGGVNKPGPYDLIVPLDVMSLISVAGGLKEYVNGKNIIILRNEGGRKEAVPLKFNYKEVQQGKNLRQNIPLKPGDTVVVPE